MQRREFIRRSIAAGAVLGTQGLALGAQAIAASDGVAVPPGSNGPAYLISQVLVWIGLALAASGLVAWAALAWWRREPVTPPLAAA